MPEKRMTPEMLERVISMRERNWTLKAISDEIGLSVGCVSWNLLREGVDPSKPRKLGAVPTLPRAVKRGNHLVRHFTVDEDQQMLGMEAKGVSIAEIGRRLGRKANSIRGRLMTLARREAREEKALV